VNAISRRSWLGGCAGALGAAAAAAGWVGSREHPSAPPQDALQEKRAADLRGWPQIFGPEGNCVSLETGLRIDWPESGPPELWRLAVGTGYSSPIVVDNDLIVLHRVDDLEKLSCFDAESGQPRWDHSWPTTYQCKYAYSSGPYGTPLIDADRVYAAGAQGQLVCLSRSTGQLRWQRDLAADLKLPTGLFGFGPGLATDMTRLYLNAGGVSTGSGLVALDKRTGETVWTATDHAMAYTVPRLITVHGHRLVLVLTETGLACLDPDTGSEHWTYPFHSKSIDTINAVTPAVQGDLVLLVAGPGPGAVCLRIEPDLRATEVWQDRRLLDSQFNSLVHHGGYLYGFTARRQGGSIFKCVEFATGKLKWEYASDLDRGQAVAADGRLILLGEHGLLTALDLDPDRLQVVCTTDRSLLASPCYSSLALSRGLLYLRNESALICLNLRGP
jgi:outer membrane protein assembly factor BamB